MEERKYTIQELCEHTGFSARTIRYYIQEGLLEPPAGRGRGGFYFDSHLQQLQQIKSLQEKGMKLTSMVGYLRGTKGEEPTFSREVWVKHEIIPGLEINIRRDLEEKQGKMVQEVLRVVKSILKEEKSDEK